MVFSLLLALATHTAAPEPVRLDRISVTARHEALAAQRPEAVTALTAGTIEAIGASHANEVFARVPGAWISRGSGQEQLTAIRSPVLSGTGACGAFLFLEDGVPIRPTGFCNVNQLFELGTEQAGRIEVLRGPGAAVHGSNALHGVVNVVPRSPAQSPRLGLAVEAGPDDWRKLQATAADADGERWWRLDLHGVSTGSFRPEEGYDQQKLGAQLAWPQASGAPRLLFSASNLNQETAGFIAGRDAYRDDRRFGNANPEAFRDGQAARLQGRWDWSLGPDLALTVVPYARHDQLRFIQHFTPGKPLEQTGSDSAGLQLMLRRDQADWSGQVGADLEYASGEVLQAQPLPLLDGPPLQQAIRPQGRHYDYRARSQLAAVFGELERPLRGRTRLLAGARLESLRYRYDNRMADGNLREDGSACASGGCLFNRPADRSDRYSGSNGQIGLLHELAEGWTVRTRAASAFRFPQAAELYRLQRGQQVADLEPERLDSLEAGTGVRRGAFGLDLAAYAMRKRNAILRDAAGFNISDGRSRHHGVELDLDWAFATGWRLGGNAAWAIQRYDFDRALAGGETITRGNEIDTAPRWLAGARLARELGPAGVVELEWLHHGGYYLDAENTERYPGHDLLHLRWRVPLSAQLDLTVRAMNLTDRRYAERADLAFGEHRYFPGAGRGVFLGLDWRAR
jgi:iron complex outermembrane receptor protein